MTVPPWLYALMFIAALMLVAWTVDRHNSRARHGLSLPLPVRASDRPAHSRRSHGGRTR